MKLLGWMIGIVAFAGLIFLSIAGVTAAVAIIVTAVAIVSMIALGSLVGGRNTPNTAPYSAPQGDPVGGDDDPRDRGDDERRGPPAGPA